MTLSTLELSAQPINRTIDNVRDMRMDKCLYHDRQDHRYVLRSGRSRPSCKLNSKPFEHGRSVL